jgi:UDP-2,3-diacylglucosamine hydrolase
LSGQDFFASDVHLAAERPLVTRRFLRFLEVVRDEGERLFLLGDIFDLWVGPKQTRMPYVKPILDKLRELTEAGVEVSYMAGNRDFNFDARVNGGPSSRELPQMLSIDSHGLRLYLTHGDLLCTGDRAYRRARFVGRSLPVRTAFAVMPLALSTFLSRGYRRLSQRAVARKRRWEMAVDFARVREYLREGHDAVVCGHVHRAARYRIRMPEGRDAEFVTLGDWSREGTYVLSRGRGLELRKFP